MNIAAAEAFAALRRAGLKHDDPDLVCLFDTSAPDFVARAKAAKPEMFDFDARTAPAAEVVARFREIELAERRRRSDAVAARALAQLGGR